LNKLLCKERELSKIISIVILALVIVIIGTVSRRAMKRGDEKTRNYAEGLGIAVKKVSRTIPVSYNKGHTYKMEEGECFEYSIPHNDNTATPCSLLQRFDSEFEKDNFWNFQCSRQPSQELQSVIGEFKKTFDEEFFEVEVKNGCVYVYWEEWGGQRMVDELLRHMRQFASTNA